MLGKNVRQQCALSAFRNAIESLERRVMLALSIGSTAGAASAPQVFAPMSVALASSDVESGRTLIDFENTPSLPAAEAGAEQDINVPGIATIRGGTVGSSFTHFPAASYATLPNSYWTASSKVNGVNADPSLQPEITIDVNPEFDVSEISFPLFNGMGTVTSYVVQAFSGTTLLENRVFQDVPPNDPDQGHVTVDIKQPDINKVTIATSGAPADQWDFIIDSIAFNGTVQQQVPVRSTSPAVTGVSFGGSGQNTNITIYGSGFGDSPFPNTTTGDLPYLELGDLRNGKEVFRAGNSAFGNSGSDDAVTLVYKSWSNNKIIIGGFAGA